MSPNGSFKYFVWCWETKWSNEKFLPYTCTIWLYETILFVVCLNFLSKCCELYNNFYKALSFSLLGNSLNLPTQQAITTVLFVGKGNKLYTVKPQELFAPLCLSKYQHSHMTVTVTYHTHVIDIEKKQNNHIWQYCWWKWGIKKQVVISSCNYRVTLRALQGKIDMFERAQPTSPDSYTTKLSPSSKPIFSNGK